jgi:hypothetical protein
MRWAVRVGPVNQLVACPIIEHNLCTIAPGNDDYREIALELTGEIAPELTGHGLPTWPHELADH